MFDSNLILLALTMMVVATTTVVDGLSTTTPKKVVVSGAGGQTGKALFRQLLKDNDFVPIGLVRTKDSKKKLVQENQIDGGEVIVCDVTDVNAVKDALDWNTIDALCICTSGTPRPTGEMKDDRPVFGFPEGGDPEIVDWIGQKSQIDAFGTKGHIVICSSMGGTEPENMLNSIGRKTDEDGNEVGGNILMWKRKSEKYLIEKSSTSSELKYTIVHPGGLINEDGNCRELIVGVDDDRVTYGGENSPRTVPREDVARVMMEACRYPTIYGNRSFDLRAHEPKEEGEEVKTDFTTLLDSLNGKNCDYSLGKSM